MVYWTWSLEGWISDTVDEGITKVVILLQTCKSVLVSSTISVLVFSWFFGVFLSARVMLSRDNSGLLSHTKKRCVFSPNFWVKL